MGAGFDRTIQHSLYGHSLIPMPEKFNPDSIKDTIRREARRQRTHARILNVVTVLFYLASYIGLPVWFAYLMIGGVGPGLFSEAPPYLFPIVLLLVYGTFFVIPFLLCLPLVLPLAIRQQNVARIVVFRKFNDSMCKKAVARVIRSKLAYYGHVYTLSDSKFRIKWWVRIPVFLGQFGLFHFRQRNIVKDEQLSSFRRKLNDYTWLNINWLLSRTKVFPVKTSDAIWKKTAAALLDRNDLILFDISYDSSALDWEINEVREQGYEKNIIAISSIHKKEEATLWKQRNDQPDDDNEIQLFFYDQNGVISDPEAFENCVVDKLALTPFKSSRESPLTRSRGMKRAAGISGIVLLIFFVALFFMSPVLIPNFTGKHTPFLRQALRSLIQSKINEPTDDRIQQSLILERIRRKWPEGSASLLLKFARRHHATECEAIQSLLPQMVDQRRTFEYTGLVLNGEPYISDTAFGILQRQFPNGNPPLAFRFLQSNRVYVREKGSQLLQRSLMTRGLLEQLFLVFILTPKKTIPEPFQHKAGGMFSGREDHAYQLDLRAEQADLETYTRLANLLIPYTSAKDSSYLHYLARADKPQGLRYLAGMLLAQSGDATGMASLSNAAGVKIEPINKVMQFFGGLAPNYPYRIKCDTILSNWNLPVHLPDVRSLVAEINSPMSFTGAGHPPSVGLFLVLMKHYPVSSFSYLLNEIQTLDVENLADALIIRYRNKNPSLSKETREFITRSKDKLLNLVSSADTEHKLKIALLLACIGEAASVSIAVELNDERHGFLNFEGYHTETEEILRVFLENMQRPFDENKIDGINLEKGSNLADLLRRIRNKLKQGR